jgi:thymidine phosphorylase
MEPLRAWQDGFVTGMQCEDIGLAAVDLGAGRRRVTDAIDPSVGLLFRKKLGDIVQKGDVLVEVHHNSRLPPMETLRRLTAAIELGAERVPPPPLLVERIE